jgi:deazaflavin-dependent oxidoreductase (nitroreductase family)
VTVLERLGYEFPEETWWSKASAAITSSRPGAWFFQRTAHRIDRTVLRWTNGRHSLSSVLVRKPVLMVTTKGRRSGVPRTVPLLGIPFDHTVALIGTNFGQAPTPGWVHNLRAEPRARIEYHGRTVDVVARSATPDEFELVFPVAIEHYAGYARYRERLDRHIEVFVLESADAGPGGED